MTQQLKQQAGRHSRIHRRRRAVLPHLGSLLLGNLYHAITGGARAPSALIKRAVAHGLNREHLEGIIRQSRQASELPRQMAAVADNHFQRALYWHDVAVKNRARDHYLECSLWLLYAALQSSTYTQRTRLFKRAQQSYALAAPHFQQPAEPVSITCPAGAISGYLRLPSAATEADEGGQEYISANHPCVLLFNGLSTPKEELHLWENALLATGLATLSFDYPTAGGAGFDGSAGELYAFNVEELANALLLFLASRPEIDVSRVAAFGTSVGGRLALYAVARLPERFRALATLSAPLELLSDINLLMPAMKYELAAASECCKAAVFDLARRTPVRALLPQMQTPLLAVGGARDLIALPEETRAIYEECGASDKKLVICSSAGHNCYEMMPSLRHEIAQWIRQRL
jgi:pimeloyl-ACP methyl ester carboxylesterase